MEIFMELNQRFGRGFQLHVMHGPVDMTYDSEPWSMYDAGACVGTLLEELNKEFNTGYQPHQVLRVTQEALEVNAKNGDFAAARMLRDIKTKRYELSTPAKCDACETVVDGKDEILFSARGVVLVSYFSWKDDQLPKAHKAMRNYCEYICARGYHGGASKALRKWEGMDKDAAVEWVRKTYARHVHDDADMIQYVMGRV